MEKVINKTTFNFTPDPKVLIALSNTPMQPLDALCELIDNSIDSFQSAKLSGQQIEQPCVYIEIPKRSELDKGFGLLRVRDNGPGMTAEEAERAIKAGYSSNNSYDNLGLFGMGFNISTSKFGRVTKFITTREIDSYNTETVIDLEKIVETKNYFIDAEQTKKSPNFLHGTRIEITEWWPEGSANYGFIRKLVQYGLPRIRQELGRRYATILKNRKTQIIVGGEPCIPFEHCVWAPHRFVERKGTQIPAVYEFDKIITTKRRCIKCRTILKETETVCPSCHSTNIRSIEERIKGWVGIQRFDHDTMFGIDLIRNGRAIRISEKAAFFEYEDEFKNITKDYPIDSNYGRIVGEVHLDHVPVDYLKQDFNRTSEEWLEAMRFLRGQTSLQPTKAHMPNDSYIYKLFQGYRKVRDFGKGDMYMGYWDKTENKAKRISRDVEKDFYERFKRHEEGYYDDAKWWEKVEEASQPPIEEMVECPICHSQNVSGTEECISCGEVLIGKTCLNPNCKATIVKSAVTCPVCGTSQIPKVVQPWICEVCGTSNKADAAICKECGKEKGAPNTLSKEYLIEKSNKDDSLSVDGLSIKLPDGSDSRKLQLMVYICNSPIIAPLKNTRIPTVIIKEVSCITMFFDASHPMFTNSRISLEETIASEVATYIFDTNRDQAKYKEYTITSIAWQILEKYWMGKVGTSKENISKRCRGLMNTIKEKLSLYINSQVLSDTLNEMTDDQTRELVNNLISSGKTINDIQTLVNNGRLINYLPDEVVLVIYDNNPDYFFNNKVWSVDYNISNQYINAEILKDTYEKNLKEYRNGLESVVLFLLYPSQETGILRKTDASIRFLEEKLGD